MTAKELAAELGLSRDQLKRRLAVLRELGLNGWARVAPGGALDLPDPVVDVLRRAVAYEREGHPMAEALRLALDQAPVAPTQAPKAPNPGDQPRPEVFPEERTDPALVRVLWTLTAILGVGVAGILGLAWYLALR